MSELSELEILLDRVLPNPMAFVERVVEQLLERLAAAPPGADPASFVPGSVLGAQSGAPQTGAPPDETLSEQNMLLSAALGACPCWGDDPTCIMCHGHGSTAWLPPDPVLYDAYVAPAAERMSAHRMATAAQGPNRPSAATHNRPEGEQQ